MLSKIFVFLLSPLSWILLFLILATFNRNNQRRKKFLVTAIVLSLFFSNTFIFDRFMHAWEVKAVPEKSLSYYDAAIVLTGMATYDPANDRLEFNDRTDRLMQAMKLYSEKKIGKIILCGSPSTLNANDSMESYRLKTFLTELGIPTTDIIVESQSRNTHENAVYMKKLLGDNYQKKYMLITSGFHLSRATACFLKEGINVFPYSTDRYAGPMKYDINYLILPSSETLFDWEKLLHEWVGCIVYFFRGYV